MNVNTTCPPDSVLSDFGLGKLEAARAEAVGQHIEACPDCRQRVAGLSGDSFADRLRHAGGAAQPASERQRTYVPGESMANSIGNTSLGDFNRLPDPEDGRPGLSRLPTPAKPNGPGGPSSIAAPELANHPDYELIKELGQGGMGTVYLAKNRMMDRLEVLKVISKSLLDRPGALERFQQEIRSAAKLAHSNIVAAYSVLRPGELLVFAMEYVRGQDLSEVVKQRGSLPVTNAVFYIHQVANGLQHAFEKGMVHRDIKPNNLMLAIEGKKHVVKILDFGLAKASSEKGAESGLTKSGQMLGTPDYVAPEQTLDAHKADIRADIYSLGCTLYFLLSGGPPFQEASLYEILEAHHKREPKPLNLVRPDVSLALAAVVAKMMAKDPTKRYQTPAEVAKALTPFFKPGQSDAGKSPSAGETARGLSIVTPAPPIASAVIPLPAPVAPSVIVAPPTPRRAADSLEDFSGSASTERPIIRGRGKWPSLPLWQRMAALLAASAGAILLLGIVFLQTKDGVIRVEINDPQIEVAIKGTDIVLKQADNGHDIRLSPGEKTLIVERGGFKFETDRLVLKKGETVAVAVVLLDGRILVKQRNLVIGVGELPPAIDPPISGDEQTEPNLVAPIDLLKQLDVKQRSTEGEWRLEGGRLVFPQIVAPSIAIYDAAPEEYTLSAVVQCPSHVGAISFGIVVGNSQAVVSIDGQGKTGSFIGMIDGIRKDNPTWTPGTFLWDEKPNLIEIHVRRNRIDVACNEQPLIKWTGDPSRLSLPPTFATRHGPRQLFLSMGQPSPFEVTTLTLTPLSAADVVGKDSSEDGWVPLFNGKDLAGWKPHPSQPGHWRVKEGVLIGSGPATSHLYSERDDFTDFHLRVEVKINKGGDSGVYARSTFGPSWPANHLQWLDGYTAQIYGSGPLMHKTGSLVAHPGGKSTEPNTSRAPRNEWFTLEVIANGNHLIAKVDGRTTADLTDAQRRFAMGHIALQQHDPQTVVEFRKIEIKESGLTTK